MPTLKKLTSHGGVCTRRILRFTLLLIAGATAMAEDAPALSWQSATGFSSLTVYPEGPRPGFTEIKAASAGLRFTNSLSSNLMMANRNFMLGSGVAAGDFDGDGWCDLYFCAMDGANALYRNLGGWRFEEVPSAGGAASPRWHSTGAVFADVDGDADLDLLISTLGNGVKLFANEAGHFVERTPNSGLVQHGGVTSLALADIDADGDLDLYAAHYGELAILHAGGRVEIKMVNGKPQIIGPHARRLRFIDGRLEEVGEPDVLYLNDGSGRFTPLPWNSEFFLDESGQPREEPWDFGLSALFRDVDLDGDPDLYVCNDFQTVDRLGLNGQGRFQLIPRTAIRKQSFASMGVDFGDINRDGFLDFFVTEMRSRNHSRRIRDIGGLPAEFPLPGGVERRPEVLQNTLFLNRGDQTFSEIARYAGVDATDWSWQPFFLDVDLDGFEDLLVCNGMPFNTQDRDALERIRALGKQSPESARTNLLLYPPHNTANFAFRNTGGWKFEEVSQSWNFTSRKISQGAALADLDNDGDLDLVSNCLNDAPLLCRNDASAPRIAVRLRGPKGNAFGAGAVIRATPKDMPAQFQEIIAGGRYLSSDDYIRTFAVQAGQPTDLEVRWPGGKKTLLKALEPNRIYLVDYTSAQKVPPEKARPHATWFADESATLDHIHHERPFSDFMYQPLLMKLLSQLGPGVAWLDLNEDGQSELFVGSGAGGALASFSQQTNRWHRIGGGTLPKVPDDLTGLAAWASADGDRSLLVAKSNYESRAPASEVFAVALEASGKFTLEKLPVNLGSAVIGPLATGDLDGDGDLDLFVGGRLIPGAYPRSCDSKIYLQDAGKLVPHSQEELLRNVGLVSSALWSDLDHDGFSELILACEWGPLRVFWNERGKFRERTHELGLAKFSGWWNGVNTGDFDGDGRLDLIAANWGENNDYTFTREHPLKCYYGEFGGTGVTDLLEVEYAPEMNAEVPVRTLNALAQAFPPLRQHFKTHESFGAATASDLLRVLPPLPGHVQATTFSSMLFLNRGDHFQPSRLHEEAQLAPAFALSVADFDLDGREDVFLSQNFFAVRPELHRLDGGRGLLLQGDGNGSFTPVPGQVSGIQVYGEQRGAAVADYNHDGRPDLAVAQNGAPVRLFRNISEKRGLRITLRGPKGNPDGIGALLRLEFQDGLGPVREIHGGGSYFSQDSPIQIMGFTQPPLALHVLWPGNSRQRVELDGSATDVIVTKQP